MGLNRLRDEFDIQPLAVYTGDFLPLCKRYDVIGYEHENLPVGAKWNAGLREALKHDWDYLMTMGSDDLMSNELFRQFEFHDEAFGITQCGGLDVRTGEKRIFTNTYVIGLGRCIRRDVIERFADMVTVRFRVAASGPEFKCSPRRDVVMTRHYAERLGSIASIIGSEQCVPKLWKDELNHGLDFSSEVLLVTNGIKQTKVLTNSILAVDLKSDVNIWPIDEYNPGTFDLDWLSQKESDAIRQLKQTDSN